MGQTLLPGCPVSAQEWLQIWKIVYQQVGIASSEVLEGEGAAALNGFVEGSQHTWLLPTPNTHKKPSKP